LVKAVTALAAQLFAVLLVLRAVAAHLAQVDQVQLVGHTAAAGLALVQILLLVRAALAQFDLFGPVAHALSHQLVQGISNA
jgi:hypothetical protein